MNSTIARTFTFPRQMMLAALFAVVALARPTAAYADAGVSCEVLEISATQGTPSIPASLKKIEKKLKRAPFTSWNNFALLSSTTKSLQKLVPAVIALSQGAAEVLVRDIDRSAGKRARLALGVTVNDAAGRRVVDTKATLDAGDYFAVGYSQSDNSGHLIAVSCK